MEIHELHYILLNQTCVHSLLLDSIHQLERSFSVKPAVSSEKTHILKLFSVVLLEKLPLLLFFSSRGC